MLENTIRKLADEIRKNKGILTDFSSKEVKQENLATEDGETTWKCKLLKLLTNYLMTQGTLEETRLRGEDELSRLTWFSQKKNFELDEGVRHEYA